MISVNSNGKELLLNSHWDGHGWNIKWKSWSFPEKKGVLSMNLIFLTIDMVQLIYLGDKITTTKDYCPQIIASC